MSTQSISQSPVESPVEDPAKSAVDSVEAACNKASIDYPSIGIPAKVWDGAHFKWVWHGELGNKTFFQVAAELGDESADGNDGTLEILNIYAMGWVEKGKKGSVKRSRQRLVETFRISDFEMSHESEKAIAEGLNSAFRKAKELARASRT